jgi:hypothetical protein
MVGGDGELRGDREIWWRRDEEQRSGSKYSRGHREKGGRGKRNRVRSQGRGRPGKEGDMEQGSGGREKKGEKTER